MNRSSARAPVEAGAGRCAPCRLFRPRFPQLAIFLLCISSVHAADVVVLSGPGVGSVGTMQLQAGAGTDFNAPVASDVLLAVLAISNTGGASWNLKIAREGNEAQWPSGVRVALKRSGGSAEAGISDGLSYRLLTSDSQAFFSGTGDYASVEIFLRLDGVTVATPPGFFSLAIRYSIEVL